MWTYEEVIEYSDSVVYYEAIMQETVGVFKAGEKIDSLVLSVCVEAPGHYTMEEWKEDGRVIRTQEVKLVACE